MPARSDNVKGDRLIFDTRHIHKIPEKGKKGPVEHKNEKETDELEVFFCRLFEFMTDSVPAAPVIPVFPSPIPSVNVIASDVTPVFPSPIRSVNVAASAAAPVFPSPIPSVNVVASAVTPVVPSHVVASTVPSSVFPSSYIESTT